MTKYVAYFRVSTTKQGRSGLGIAAQRTVLDGFLGVDDEMIAEFVEVQSGKIDQRVELWKAIAFAKKSNAKILIAKLDRFSRKVSFIAGIMEQGIGLVVAEMPHASDFQLHIFAALAQEERRLISERTRNALREAKKRGVDLGKNGRVLAFQNRLDADSRALELAPLVSPLLENGTSYCQIAAYLNQSGVLTLRGGKFHAQQAKNLVARIQRLKMRKAA
jgi:DNA invertase Pin-like site-specific DNA recombinase|tara:strand:+ start:8547 stop:9203 length:657 start_codon:yes stop_codon:yes gene_type:complete